MLKSCAFLLVLGLIRVCNARSFPMFEKIPEGLPVSDSMTSSAVRPKEWHAAWPTNYRLILLGHKEITFTMFCFVHELKAEDDKLTEITFCFNEKSGSSIVKNCRTLSPDVTVGTMDVVVGKGPKVKLEFNPTTGGSAKLDDVRANFDISSQFSCSVRNRRGSVSSNKIDFIDVRAQFPNSIISYAAPTQPIYTRGPSIFPCANINAPPEVTLAYAWFICPGGDFRFCNFPVTITATDTWPVQILRNGSLYFPYLTNQQASNIMNRIIYCSVEKIPTALYTRKIQISKLAPPNEVKSLKITYPPSAKNVKVKLLNSQNTVVSYYCNFEVGPGTYKVTWKKYPKDGGDPIILKPGIVYKFRVGLVPNHGIRFTGPFTAETEGKYLCEIEWTPTSGISEKKSAGYDISLQYFPEVDSKFVPEIYVVSGKNGSFTCAFKKPFAEPKPTGNTVKPSLAINGYPIKLGSESDVSSSISTINTRFSTTMAPLTVSVDPVAPKPGNFIQYTAIKMTDSSVLHGKPMTHMVDCIGTNDVGTVRRSVLLKVVPNIELSSSPSDTNCTSCSAKQDHEFKCVIKNLEAYNRTSSIVIVNQYWKVGNSIMDKSNGFIVISSDNTTLTVKKVNDQKVKDSLNSNGKITCVITMRYPGEMKEPDDLMVGPFMTKIFYNSEKDPVVSKVLSTVIQLEDIAPVAKAAGLHWAIPVGLSIFVFFIVVLLVVLMCRKRSPGETYDVDHTEKKQGNDPEAENHEKEAFPVYERPEDGPIRGSRASLDDSIHVGSDDEDEDLAEYDVDIGKFNEEGSFIGQYAVNDGHGGGQPNNSRKLPNVSNNSAV